MKSDSFAERKHPDQCILRLQPGHHDKRNRGLPWRGLFSIRTVLCSIKVRCTMRSYQGRQLSAALCNTRVFACSYSSDDDPLLYFNWDLIDSTPGFEAAYSTEALFFSTQLVRLRLHVCTDTLRGELIPRIIPCFPADC